MERWHETPGLAWIHRGLVDPAPDAHLAAVALGRGYAHQTVRDLGVATAAAGVLRRELTGPVETARGVGEVRAQVDVDLQDTLVLLSGSEEGLRTRLGRLAELLADPDGAAGADLTPPAERLAHPYAGAGREVGAWFGAGPASLSCEVDPAEVAPGSVAAWLRALHPSTGTPAVGFTTLEPLVGAVFDGAGGRGRPDVLRWRQPGPASIVDGAPAGLLSMAAESTTPGGVAQRLLLDVVRDALGLAGLDVAAARASATTVGDRRLVVAQAVAGKAGYDRRDVHAAVSLALESARGLPTDRFQQVLYALRTDEARAVRSHPVRLLLETLRSGAEQRSAVLEAELETTTPADVRAALERLLGALLVNQPPGVVPAPGYPLRLPETTPPGRPDSVHQARIAVALPDGDLRLTRAEVHGDRLLAFGRPRAGHGKDRVAQEVDLTRIAARFDQGDPGGAGSTTLVDEDGRRVVLPWAALARRGTLRRVVDAAAPQDRVRTLPPDPVWTDSADRRRRRSRRVLVGVGAFLALVALVIVVSVRSASDDLRSTVEEVRFGEEASLSNGTTLEVSELRDLDGGPELGPLKVADVQFCAGDPDPVGDVAESARNYVTSARFRLDGTPNNTLAADPPGEELLREATVAEGDCLDGVVGFQVPEGTPDVGVGVRYANGVGDQITWR